MAATLGAVLSYDGTSVKLEISKWMADLVPSDLHVEVAPLTRLTEFRSVDPSRLSLGL
jgi:hypothetical protein